MVVDVLDKRVAKYKSITARGGPDNYTDSDNYKMASKSQSAKTEKSDGVKATSDSSKATKGTICPSHPSQPPANDNLPGQSTSKDGKKASTTPFPSEEKPDTEPSAEDENASFSASAIPDTLDARLTIRKLQVSEEDQPYTSKSRSEPVDSDDGPLILTLLLNNRNNNKTNTESIPAPDTLDARLAVYEVLPPKVSHERCSPLLVRLLARQVEVHAGKQPIIGRSSSEVAENDDGPLLLGLLLTNQNNAAAAQHAPAPDTLDARYAVHEVLPPKV
jgi:hypothetical protein